MTAETAAVRSAARRLSSAHRVTVVTGAGVSAASGVPTFRGSGGLWRTFRAEELATPRAFTRDPKTVWEWYDWRRAVVSKAEPNEAHHVIARWSRRFDPFALITQNVDGLHERAGTLGVVRFHGSLWTLRCAAECGVRPDGWDDPRPVLPVLPPLCPDCGALARPGVVWFGERIPEPAMETARRALDCDVCLVIGTSSVVHPAAGLVESARSRGAYTIEVNPEATPASSRVHLAIAGRAEEVLPLIDARLSSSDGDD